MAAPLYSPSKGTGSQVSSGGTVYQFNQGGWTPVASGGGSKPAPAPAPVVTKTPAVRTTTQPSQTQPQQQSFSTSPVYTAPSFDQEAYNREIENAYNAGMGYLTGVEAQLQPQYQSALQEAQAAYNTQQALLSGQKQQAETQLGEQATKGQQAYESALAQARQMYDQLQRGYQQRFGGASSAGQAATEIANVERLRQQGQNYRSLQDVNRQVEAGMQDVQRQYNTNLLQLEQNKISAQNQARRDFEDKLNQINAQKAQLGINKSQQRLQALQELRTQLLSIDQANRQFQMSLELQRQQNALALQNYAAQTGKTLGTAIPAAQARTQAITPGSTQALVPQYTTSTQLPSTYQGYAQQLSRPEDFYKSLSLPALSGSSAQLRTMTA